MQRQRKRGEIRRGFIYRGTIPRKRLEVDSRVGRLYTGQSLPAERSYDVTRDNRETLVSCVLFKERVPPYSTCILLIEHPRTDDAQR